ncbi:MAG: sulfatase-like hydrolase/transferase [Bacteroidaceae bacterium]|nr:sulfatase-like hydrolase/transferase [Bacteroidaceae bacterium]
MKSQHLLLPCLGVAATALAQSVERPNVILLVADDLGYGDLSCYGATRVETPRVDSLAAHGVRFTDCHACASTSTPSRYSLLTGEYAFRRPGTDIAPGNEGMIIKPDQYTLADMFHSAGYRTAAIGKWHLGLGSVGGQQDWNAELDWTPRDIGFDYHYLMAATADRVPCVFIEQGRVANHDPENPLYVSYVSNFEGEPTGATNPELLTKLKSSHGHNQSIVNGIGRIGYMKGGGRAVWRDEILADSIVVKSVDFIAGCGDEPFFMYLCTNDVHVPRYPADRFRGQSPMGLRGDVILQFDYTVGAIVDALDSLGLRDNTLIIVTSDNGPVLDDGYQDQAEELVGTHKPGGPFRGGKYSAFEAGTAVPFIVSWPARIKEGAVSDALISHIDDIASLAALIGADVPVGAAYDSQNHIETWLGEDATSRDWVVEMAQDRTLSLRTKRWKYIEPSNGNATVWGPGIETGYNSSPQLYNISTSRYESSNVYTKQPAMARRMTAQLAELRQPMTSADTCFWYHLYTPGRGPRYATSTGAGQYMTGPTAPAGDASQWKFTVRADGTYDIVNRADGSYLLPETPTTPASRMKTSAAQPATGWTLTTNGIMNCLFAVVSGTAQLNQGEVSNSWNILNWGSGTNTSDVGCRYAVAFADAEVAVPNDPTGLDAVELPADSLAVVDGAFVLGGSGRRVELYTVGGRRVAPTSLSRLGGIYIVKDGERTMKVAL